MATIILNHRLKDYAAYKPLYHANLKARKAEGGVISEPHVVILN